MLIFSAPLTMLRGMMALIFDSKFNAQNKSQTLRTLEYGYVTCVLQY